MPDSTWIISVHLAAALAVLVLGTINLAAAKGTLRHKTMGWVWIVAMLFVTVPSYWIRETKPGELSCIHLLSVVAFVSMAWALIAIRRGNVQAHARAMAGTMIGAIIAGAFALLPGRFISELLGYGFG